MARVSAGVPLASTMRWTWFAMTEKCVMRTSKRCAAPANALALAQEHYPHMAGSAAALFGSIQFGIGAISGILVGLLHDGTAVPMAAIIVTAAAIALAVNLLLTPKEARSR